MSQDMFIKMMGIDGESKDMHHKNEIDVGHWEWNMEQLSSMHSGSGGGAGKAAISDLTFWHSFDRASPNLMRYCLTGKHISEAILVNRKAGGDALEYIKISMKDVVITKVHPISSDDGVVEQVSLSFSSVKQEYVVQNEQGGKGGIVTGMFDIKSNN